MAETSKSQIIVQEKKLAEKKPVQQFQETEILVRIFGYDMPASKNIYTGLTRIKGVSWAIANALCIKLKIPHSTKVSQLTKEKIAEIELFLKNIDVPDFMKNRRLDIETGITAHLYGSDLDMKRDFDIKRLKKIRSYIGIRHMLGQPVRGQRTRSHFRKRGVSVGVMKKSVKPASAQPSQPSQPAKQAKEKK